MSSQPDYIHLLNKIQQKYDAESEEIYMFVGEGLDPGEQVATASQQLRAERRELDSPRPSRSVEPLLAARPFERGDLLTDSRLCVAEPFGGPRKRSFRSNRIERQQMPKVEVAPHCHQQQHI